MCIEIVSKFTYKFIYLFIALLCSYAANAVYLQRRGLRACRPAVAFSHFFGGDPVMHGSLRDPRARPLQGDSSKQWTRGDARSHGVGEMTLEAFQRPSRGRHYGELQEYPAVHWRRH